MAKAETKKQKVQAAETDVKAAKPRRAAKKTVKSDTKAETAAVEQNVVAEKTTSAENTQSVEDCAESAQMVKNSVEDSLKTEIIAEDTPVVSTKKAQSNGYDVMITTQSAGYRPAKRAVYEMVQQLAFRCFASPVDEAVAETWTEIYFEPGPAAHEIFLEKAYVDDAPVFREMVLKFSEKPFYCDYSETPKRPLYWAIEVLGCRFREPLGAFRKLFLDSWNLRLTVSSTQEREAQPHKVVPPDEMPVEKKKKERGRGLAGTEVEEV